MTPHAGNLRVWRGRRFTEGCLVKRQVAAGSVAVVVRFLGVERLGVPLGTATPELGAPPSIGIENKYMDSFHLLTLLGRELTWYLMNFSMLKSVSEACQWT